MSRCQRCGGGHRTPGRRRRRAVPDPGPRTRASSGADRPRADGMLRQPPRLYVVTRNAQTVLPDDRANLDQAGLRGLMRVIAAEETNLRATQIDVDEGTDAKQVARQLLAGSDEDETAWRSGSGTRPGYALPRCAPTSGEPPPPTISTTVCAWRSALPVTWKAWSSPLSTALHRSRDRSRSRSPHPASTSPMCSSPWADTLASTDVNRSSAWISQAW